MRNTKELLQLLLINEDWFNRGLCALVCDLTHKGIFSKEEGHILFTYINTHRPSKFSSIAAWKSQDSLFYWPVGEWKPRKRWLKAQIRKL